MNISSMKLLAVLFLALPASTLPVLAAEHPVTLWELQGEHNRVFILGSMHMLRSSDYPIPSVIYEAFEEAETLIMELDLDDLDPQHISALVLELGMLSNGDTLEKTIGKQAYADALRLAAEVEIPLAMLANTKPWLAAMTVETMILTRAGFDPANGIEKHLMKMAQNNKEILGLETERQQLEMLDNLSLDAQRDMLLQTLTDADELEEILDEIVEAWRHGDTHYMVETLLSDLAEFEELYESIVVARNRNWADQIDALLDDKDDYLIVVGTMHLVGKDGVPALLKNRGLKIQQMQQKAHWKSTTVD